jgi:predicted RNA-binding protein with TRAM domain
MEYSGERRGFNAPINVGETYDVTIEEVGREGDGITRVEGFVVFVPNTQKGDAVKVRITKVSRRVGFGEVVTE